MTAIDKAEIERKLDAEWQALREAIESFSDEELEAPGAVEEWSVKDLLGHMAFWANKAAAAAIMLACLSRPDDFCEPTFLLDLIMVPPCK